MSNPPRARSPVVGSVARVNLSASILNRAGEGGPLNGLNHPAASKLNYGDAIDPILKILKRLRSGFFGRFKAREALTHPRIHAPAHVNQDQSDAAHRPARPGGRGVEGSNLLAVHSDRDSSGKRGRAV